MPLLGFSANLIYIDAYITLQQSGDDFEIAHKTCLILVEVQFPHKASFPHYFNIHIGFLRDAPKTEPGIDGTGDKDRKDACSNDIPEACSAVGFKSTSYPNKFDHESSKDALEAYEVGVVFL